MKKIKKGCFIIIIAIILISILIPHICYAQDLGLGELNNYKGSNSSSTSLNSRVENILGVIRVIGTVLSVIMLIVIGIKYMLGSVEEKAEYKKTLIPYIIGAFMIFTGTIVPQVIYDFMQNL